MPTSAAAPPAVLPVLPCADLSDILGEDARVLAPGLTHFGGRRRFSGPVTTLKLFEDNSLVRSALGEPGRGQVLVVDGGGSLRCALVGGNLGALGARNGWAGVVVAGCVRDTRELEAEDLGVLALAAHPRKSTKRNEGQRDVAVEVQGVHIVPGDLLFADEDGVLVVAADVELPSGSAG